MSKALPSPEIERRKASLEKAKQLLMVLKTSAENPQNRPTLTDAVAQLKQLEGLLSPVPEPVPPFPATQPEPAASSAPQSTPPPKTFNAEKVANEVRANRFQVRAAILFAWELDETFTQTSESVSVEIAKCRVSSLAVKGI